MNPIIIKALIERFENDIRYSCHSTLISYCRSKAGAALESLSRDDLRQVIRHIRALPAVDNLVDEGVRNAWGMWLHDLSVHLRRQARTDIPRENLTAWIIQAEVALTLSSATTSR